ncbi:hypothetical protein [Endozoicomonas sp. SESOKO1]|uniref:hypothetical protein n=1 Tax=Endozoicomonas sp. SESOKO1 TaxID=2828742 RepID=UPI0021480A70|nr:hypothetical protein [Endozoicomonas sp. SESOKO1]
MANEELLVHRDGDEAHVNRVTIGKLQSTVSPFAQLRQYGVNLKQHIGLTRRFPVHSALIA